MENLIKTNHIRNFTIIAHVDHGKSTLADSILMLCGAISAREYKNQLLDSMSIERDRGITIKAQTVRLQWKDHILNLIDTPGHSDFAYEVSRSLHACEISILLIDATKGVEAQTISNLKNAQQAGHFIIPVLNKIDLPTANINSCYEAIDNLGLDINMVHEVSAKTGAGVEKLLESIIRYGPCPKTTLNETRALIVDSWYDKYLGVVTLVRMIDGKITEGQKVKSCSNDKNFNVLKVGVFTPEPKQIKELSAGEIGYVVTQVKIATEIHVGDTFIGNLSSAPALEGFQKVKPVVFCTFYPENPEEADFVHDCLKKYVLNDSGFCFTVEHSDIYGMMFLCGFLGLLHLEIVKERLELEFEVFVVVTMPTVIYRVKLKTNDNILEINNANKWPVQCDIEYMEEPEAFCTIYVGKELGKVSTLCVNRRAEEIDIKQIEERFIITCKIPLSEIIVDFFDELQSLTSGYASFEYTQCGFRQSTMDKIIILVNDEIIKEFGLIVHSSKAMAVGKNLVEKLKEIIPQAQIPIKIQAAVNSKTNIVARSTISPFRKDVTAGLYGGDITRKNKHLDRQKKGKSRMLSMSRSHILNRIPKNSIRDLLKIN